jgi:hypothetical protein
VLSCRNRGDTLTSPVLVSLLISMKLMSRAIEGRTCGIQAASLEPHLINRRVFNNHFHPIALSCIVRLCRLNVETLAHDELRRPRGYLHLLR